MNTSQIERNVIDLVGNFNKEEFIYDLLLAYGISKTSITRLKKGDFNLSKIKGEVLYKKKVLFKEVKSGTLLNTIDELTKSEESLKHNPRFVIVTDYKTLLAKDTRTGLNLDTPIHEIQKHFAFFLPWSGHEKYLQKNENYADRKASYRMAKLYDILVTINPTIYKDGGHNLNIFLSRLLFCFFAEDTDIFPIEGMFTDTLGQHTKPDGSNVHIFLNRLFKVLNTEDNSKEASHLREFPYVNGDLFKDNIISPKFNKEARNIIIDCGELDWSEINPDIFGSMIQAVVNPAYRSGLGMHYTSVPNIMKVIEPLFLNELKEEFEKQKENNKKLRQLIYRISKLKIFDPACGSGNFLIIAYKELRKLEIEIWQQIDVLKKQQPAYQTETVYTAIKLSQFYGIEIDDFAHEMAILSLWLAEHQMNKIFVDELFDFGRAKPILPLKEAGHITQGNATRIDWVIACPKEKNDEVFILGNPPYLGFSQQNSTQKEDIQLVWRKSVKVDYISCWLIKGKGYINNSNSKLAFVSTNSICQGEQVFTIWSELLSSNVVIDFCYSSFPWKNSAKGNAGVICVIIGLANSKYSRIRKIYFNGTFKNVTNISPYLTSGNNTIIKKRAKPISNFPMMTLGDMAKDGGNLFLTPFEKNNLIHNHPSSIKFVRELIGAKEFLNGYQKWCLWINDENIEEAKEIPFIKERLDKVVKSRLASKKIATQKFSLLPHQFVERRFQEMPKLLIPTVSSSRREYIPIGFFSKLEVINAPNNVIYNPLPYVFGIIHSKMHIVWVEAIGGKLKNDYRYSATLCYNTFPFPKVSQKQKEQLNLHVFEILGEREKHTERTLAQLYDPDKMPNGLKEAHHQLDLAIERCYRLKPFTSDTERLEYLFKLYEEMTKKDTLFAKQKRKYKKKK